jgi:hypothetical protein
MACSQAPYRQLRFVRRHANGKLQCVPCLFDNVIASWTVSWRLANAKRKYSAAFGFTKLSRGNGYAFDKLFENSHFPHFWKFKTQ